jgi:hypothetical protein
MECKKHEEEGRKKILNEKYKSQSVKTRNKAYKK